MNISKDKFCLPMLVWTSLLSLPKKLILLLIAGWQLTRIFRAPSCRFYPSCSEYMAGCVERHGALKGAILTILRLAKCHPLHSGGVDEVPSEFLAGLRQPCSAKVFLTTKR